MQIRSGVKGALTTAFAATLVLSTTSTAKANGRFPRGEHLIEYPSDPNRMILAATYGLVTTEDSKDWHYVCETAFSLFDPPTTTNPGFTGDPLLALTADESIIAGVDVRITRSPDRGCGWSTAYQAAGKTIVDIAVAPSNRNTAVALVQTPASNLIQVFESTDGGVKWDPIGMPLPSLALAYTIDVDPKDPNHLMVTGVTTFTPGTDTGVFVNSTNHGMTWTVTTIPKTSIDAPPYIAAIHPTDPMKIFVRTDEWVDDGSGATFAADALHYSKDGGKTWTELLRPKGMEGGGAKLFGFALSPDGGTVLAGFGDPVSGGGRNVDRSAMGVYKSTGADYAFGATPAAILAEATTCLTWTAKGIYLCGSPDGMTSYVGFAPDLNRLTPAGMTKIMQVDKLKGEPPCCNGRAVAACDWAVECVRFDACIDGGTSVVDAGVCTMPEAGKPDAPEGGAAGRAGAAGADGGAGTGGAGTGGTGGASTGGTGGAATGGTGGAATGGSTSTGTGGSGGSGDSCSCRTVGRAETPGRGLGLLLGLAAATRLGRLRRRRSAS